MKFLLILICTGVYGQQLHHQMISSQGATNTVSNGMTVRSTVGQSVTGNSKKQYIIQQGFQQNYWIKYIASNKSDVSTITYPNPFTDNINFKFSEFVGSSMGISVFDITGKMITSGTLAVKNNETYMDLRELTQGVYLVRLSSKSFEYFTQIIKK